MSSAILDLYRLLKGIILVLALTIAGCGSTPVGAEDETEDKLLDLPARPADALSATELIREIESLELKEREHRLVREILTGNVPTWLRTLEPVSLEATVDGRVIHGTVHVLPDYLSVGSDNDYLLIPLSPGAAQQIADATDTLLPTTRLVDAIWEQSLIHFRPQPIPPSPAMTTIPVFVAHNDSIRLQRLSFDYPPGTLVAGHKKDVVITNGLKDAVDRVAIYGWHREDGTPIQPLYTGHVDWYADYSHGIRLISRAMLLDGQIADLRTVLKDVDVAPLVSDEGAVSPVSY